jgi:aspartate kinase
MNETLTVHKFGGSCLRDASDLDRIAEVIGDWKGQSIVVVSALWGTTDRLMRASKEPRYASRLVNDLSSQHLRFAPGLLKSELGPLFTKVLTGIEQSLVELAKQPADRVAVNRLLAAGERLSALVVAHRLKQHGIIAHPVGSEDIGLRLNGINRAPTVDLAASMGLLDRKALHDTPVITGWFGEGNDGELALLSRGGSDHTATSIARLVDASRVILWKDVEGVLPLNPRWGIETEPISYLGYGEAMELSRLDTPILHPATVEPLADTGIPLEIRHLRGSMQSQAATVIGPDLYEANVIKAIGCLPRVVSIRCQTKSLGQQSGKLGDILVDLDKAEIACWHLDAQPGELRWIVSQHDVEVARELIEKQFGTTETESFSAIISLVGNQFDAQREAWHSDESARLGIEVLSDTGHAVRMLTKNDDMVDLLHQLSQRCGLKHALQSND